MKSNEYKRGYKACIKDLTAFITSSKKAKKKKKKEQGLAELLFGGD